MPVATINPAKHSLKRTEVLPRPRECRQVQDDPDENEPEEEVADPVRFESAKKGTRLPRSRILPAFNCGGLKIVREAFKKKTVKHMEFPYVA